jgi:ATP-dependent protease HslVU (ClpYQ) peptidase subunit
MSIIAFDGKTVAADKRQTDNCGLARTVTKIFRHRGMVVAVVGNYVTGIEMVEWWRAGAVPSDFPASAREDKTTIIAIGPNSVLVYTNNPYPVRQEDAQAAFGSGRDFAIAAMALGKTAIEAVELACRFQSDCGNGIDVMEVA